MYFFVTEVEDTYHTVGLKLLSAFKWIYKASGQPNSKLKWILKLDDDVLLNVNMLMNQLKVQENVIHCPVYERATPFRDANSKW